jgi:hypothetical protein
MRSMYRFNARTAPMRANIVGPPNGDEPTLPSCRSGAEFGGNLIPVVGRALLGACASVVTPGTKLPNRDDKLFFQSAGTAIPAHRFSFSSLLHEGFRMKRDLFLSAVLLSLFTPPAFGRMPELNVTAVCKARSDDAKILRSRPDQSIADCVRDEEAAKQQLSNLWASTAVRIRNRCQSDARSLGTTSYLDLLTCIQMPQVINSNPKKETGK